MHLFLTYFPINHYQLGVAHSNEVPEEAQRSNIGVKVLKRSKRSKKFICQNSYLNTRAVNWDSRVQGLAGPGWTRDSESSLQRTRGLAQYRSD